MEQMTEKNEQQLEQKKITKRVITFFLDLSIGL